MAKFIDLTGMIFGDLIVIKLHSKKPTKWLCKCKCGNTSIVDTRNLRSGHTTTCGCSKYKTPANATHKLRNHRLYNVWNGIKQRCNNPNNQRYNMYGGRGIKICDEWNDNFKNFYDWAMDNGYNENAKYGECTIDRINNNGNYEPDNCRIVSFKVQANNTSRNNFITFNGETHTLSQWSEILNISKRKVETKFKKLYNINKI